MPRIALVTTNVEALGDEDLDLAIVREALIAAGLDAEPVIWHEPGVDWSAYDLVLMRSPWDYSERLDDFLSWLSSVGAQTTVLNPPELIRWNLDKEYLLELEAAGVPIVPTTVCRDLDAVREAIAEVKAERIVVKPTISAGSRDTGLFARDDAAALALAAHILAQGKVVMIQPAIASVQEHGELALLHFDGEFSHCIRKGPLLEPGGGLLGGEYAEVIAPEVPPSEYVEVAARAVAAIEKRFHGEDRPLYARLDLVAGDDGPLLLEAELFEPSYFLATAPGAETRFAGAVVDRLRSLR